MWMKSIAELIRNGAEEYDQDAYVNPKRPKPVACFKW